MSMVGIRQTPDLSERGWSRYGDEYQKSALGRPQYVRIIAQQATEIPVTSGQSIQYQFGRKGDLFLAAFRDGCTPYIEFDLRAERAAGTPDVGWCKVEPWRMIRRAQHQINNEQINKQEEFREVINSMEIVDRPLDWLRTEGAAMGVDVLPQATQTTFGSSIATYNNTDRLDSEDTYTAAVAGGTGTVQYDMPTSSSLIESYGNGTIKYGLKKRFRLPLDFVVSGPLSDPDSLVPYASDHLLWLYFNDPALFAYDVPTIDNGTTLVNNGQPQPVNIYISNCQLFVNQCFAYGDLRREANLLVNSNQWLFRTTTSIVTTRQLTLGDSGGAGDVNFGSIDRSIKSMEVAMWDPGALVDPTIASKTTMIDNGITQWYFNVGTIGQNVPAIPAECGYPNQELATGNRTDGFVLYNNFRNAKMAQNRAIGFYGSGAVTPLMYDGFSHYTSDGSAGSAIPLPGFYPTAAAFSGGAVFPKRYYVNVVRAFKIAVDLSSVTNDDSFVSGTQGGLIGLHLEWNGLRAQKVRYASSSSFTTLKCNGAQNLYLHCRVNNIIYTGVSNTVQVTISNPAYAGDS